VNDDKPKLKVTDRRHWVSGENGGEKELRQLPSYVEKLQKKLDANDAKLNDYIAAYKEKMAENDKFRTRLEKDVDRRVSMKIADFMRGILPVLDNLGLAKESAKSTNEVETVVKGIGLIQSGLMNLLQEFGMEELDCLGKEFDPAIAEAVGVVESREKDKNGKVLEVMRSGYKVGGMLLRPAKVKVGKLAES
jgi:molecular chaperone GrpE